jgi:predicted transcriptional regulator
MTVRVAIDLDEEQKARLDALAQSREASPADLIVEAVTAYLEHDAWFRAEVQKGLDDVAAGRVHDWREVKAELRARFGGTED